jgi:hypothetical protein
MANLRHEASQRTVQDIANLYKNHTLNLSPGFQRNSVWTQPDREKLIDSLIRNHPLPAIFLYRRQDDGEIIYDVIDGKQRIESLLMFMGLMHGNKFRAKVQMPADEGQETPEEDTTGSVDWKTLCKEHKQHLITGYKISTIEVDGDPADIIDLFVRINSTGKALTKAEKQHAKYYKSSNLLSAAHKLASNYEKDLLKNGVLTRGQISRMRHVELMCELIVSVHQGDVINKKTTLDKMMKQNSFTKVQAKKASIKVASILKQLSKMFPQFGQTRFHQISDFYSLVVLISKFQSEKLVLTDSRRNKLAWDILRAFASEVDGVRELQKKVLGAQPEFQTGREYLLTVTHATDALPQRKKREQILRKLLESLFERKDEDRFFSPEQRRIIWNTTDERICTKCGKPVTWDDFTVDHIKPHTKGGRTELDNAALMHRGCNASKGSS